MSTASISVDVCPHGVRSVSLNLNTTGVRLTPGKCCGRSEIEKGWPMTAERLRGLANELNCAADALEMEAAR